MSIKCRRFKFGLSVEHQRTAAGKFDGVGSKLDERIRVYGGSRVDVPAVDSVDVGSKRHSVGAGVANKKGCCASASTQRPDP